MALGLVAGLAIGLALGVLAAVVVGRARRGSDAGTAGEGTTAPGAPPPESRLAATLERISDAFYTVDRDWCVTYANRQALAILTGRGQDVLGRNFWHSFPHLVDTPLYHAFHAAMAGDEPVVLDEWWFRPIDRWFTLRVHPSDHGLSVYFRDVTRERSDRLALQSHGAKLSEQAELLDKASDAIIVSDLDDRITYFNRRAELLYGWTAREAIGQSSRALLHEDVDVYDDVRATVQLEGEWAGELHQHDSAGEAIVVESSWTLVRDDDGEPRSIMVINADVTERRAFEQHLARVQRMESIGELAGGIAHDLNNVLTPVMMAEPILRRGETDPVKLKVIDLMAGSARRGADIVGQILTFARGVEGERVTVDVDELLAEVQRFADETFLKSVRTTRDADPDLWPVVGDPTQLHQVLLNLCVNARDAMPSGGQLSLSAANVVVDAQAVRNSDVATGRYVRLAVKDEGSGMPPDVVQRIFEPFFTTKGQGQGTGLGLSVTAGIVRSHGGFIEVDSRPGEGTTFEVHLPAAPDGSAAQAAGAGEGEVAGGGEVVLVVDDEEVIRTTVAVTLEGEGYDVLVAGGGAEAAELASQREDVAVVVTDMMMPGMDGAATIRAIREHLDDVPVIASSGVQTAISRAELDDLDVQAVLPKPFTTARLLRTVREVLDGTG
ncbi:ATP-binding protein [Euzebya sp.]|uniref:PAS domain-containing hybrid sensor histidine kinase/response regulator n=1 Tax=Euzebya sp. TaxID=1971409 RepID=UPI00355A7D4C